MKAKRIGTASLTVVMAIGIVVSSLAADDPTEPRGGKPANGSKPSVKDLDAQVKYQRAFEAVLWSMPAVSKYGFHRASVEIGAGNNVVMASSGPAKPNFELLTANNVTPYVTSTSDLSKGPLVLEVPKATDKAMLFGQVADNWFVTTADIGPIGVDKGKGAKLLITPPDYKGPVPDEYIEVKSPSYIIDFAFRSIQGPNGSPQDAAAKSKSIKIYYLSKLPNPKPTRVIDPVDTRWSTLPRYDERWFEDLYQRVLDDRLCFYYYATGSTPMMVKPMVGKGSVYEIGATDINGEPLDGGKTYKVTLPAPIPAKDFWSFMAYDNQTRSILETDQKTGGLDSNSEGVKLNDDGSATVYFGPKAPEGHKGNWVQTMPGKGYNVLLRLYGPLEPWFDKTWMPGDFEPVE